jgi:hypothetical protein
MRSWSSVLLFRAQFALGGLSQADSASSAILCATSSNCNSLSKALCQTDSILTSRRVSPAVSKVRRSSRGNKYGRRHYSLVRVGITNP